MKNIHIIFILLMYIFTSSAVYSAKSENITTVSASFGHWPPYIICNGQDSSGFLLKIVEDIYAARGIKLISNCLPWARAFKETRYGDYDISFSWIKSSERESYFIYSKYPVGNEEYVFFHLKKHNFERLKNNLNVDELKKYRIGITRGYYMPPILKEIENYLDISNSDKQGFKKLLRGRIDLLYLDLRTGYYIVSKLDAHLTNLITNIQIVIDKNNTYAISSRSNPRGKVILEILDDGLREIRDSGYFDKVYSENMISTQDLDL